MSTILFFEWNCDCGMWFINTLYYLYQSCYFFGVLCTSPYSRRLLSKLATSVDAWSLIFYSDKRFSNFHLYRFHSIDLFNQQHDRIILAECPLFCHGIGVHVSFVRKAKVFCPHRECFPEVLVRLRNTC